MKRVNFDPELELKKIRIMEEFNQDNGPEVDENQPRKVVEIDESEIVDEDVLRERVIEALKTVYDPEIPVNIYDLGLIYDVRISNQFVDVDMTLTAPGCPVAHTFPGMVERSVALVPGVSGAAVELVWDPPWTSDLISEAARLELGLI
jgi:FeS assembly SUF system protein